MATIGRVRVALTGFIGSPGVSTFYAVDPATLLGPLRTYYNAIRELFPSVVRIQVEDNGDSIDDVTGVLTGSWSGGAQTVVSGGSNPGYSAPAGATQRWSTDAVVDGHRLKGRTFLVPLASAAYDVDGTLGGSTVTTLTDAGAALVAATTANFSIWHRPIAAGAPHGPRAGTSHFVTSASVNDMVAVLRSRRD